jgi:hypothetical protein
MERSETPRCDALLSLKLPKSLKRDVEQSAERKDRSVSEEARQRLQDGKQDT